MKLMDEKKLGFTTAVELSYIGKKNQNYIACLLYTSVGRIVFLSHGL